tara:strand:- start:112 stop:1143 length:1032 start_codon:yes stop_codon:yes gene_type:complete
MNILITQKHSLLEKDILVQKNKDKKCFSMADLNYMLSVLKIEKIKSLDEYYSNIRNSLLNQDIRWSKYLSIHRKKEYNDYLKKRLSDSESLITEYFYLYFPERLSLFKKIHPLDDKNPAFYKHSSVTGRLSIEKGINYLVMKKDVRNELQSPFDNHQLYELDFKSCEPNLYCRHFNLVPNDTEDIYEYISGVIGEKFDNRDKLKRVILSILYGANENSVKKISKLPIKKIRAVKDLLNVESFNHKLDLEFNQNGFVKNMYGRPILSNSNLVNYWIQSSAADYCCLAFNNFFKTHPNLKLHAVIHDAVIFSADGKDYKHISKLNELYYENLSIPIKINRVQPHN